MVLKCQTREHNPKNISVTIRRSQGIAWNTKMPYKYIGKTTDFKGKTLWEIVGNLKKYGVGRIVTRNIFERYHEPVYYKILKVDLLPCPVNQNVDHLRRTKILVEKTFRGETLPKPITLNSASYKTDYKLIPKDEEEAYCPKVAPRKVKLLPKFMEFPPLMREFLKKELNLSDDKDVPKLEIVYNMKNKNYIDKMKVVEQGADVEFKMNLGKTSSTTLYNNIKVTKT